MDSSCQAWKETGRAPFPMLVSPSSLDWHGLDPHALRYFFFLASLGDTLDRNQTRQFCLWWTVYDVYARQIPYGSLLANCSRGLQIAARYDFVAYAQIVLAANRLGRLTKQASIMEDAARYKILAIKGLREALACFSRENADGVLAASVILMYQQQTPADWQKISQGTAAVMKNMRPWARSSGYWPVLQHIYMPDLTAHCRIVTNKETCSDQKTLQHSSPLVTLRSLTAAVNFLLDQGLTAMGRLLTCLRTRKQLAFTIRGLADMLRLAQVRQSTGQRHDAFWLAYPFSDSLTNREAISFAEIHASDPLMLLVLAYMYSSLAVLSMLYPEIDTAGFIAIRLFSLDNLARHFHSINEVDCKGCGDSHKTQELLAFPWNAVRGYRQWRADLDAQAHTF
jgi:hypothetical protein